MLQMVDTLYHRYIYALYHVTNSRPTVYDAAVYIVASAAVISHHSRQQT